MKRYQRLLSLLLALLMFIGSLSTASAVFVLPAGLTAVEEEAFADDTSLQGLLTLPAGINTVGKNAFKGSGLFALNVPASVSSIAAQESLSLAYVHVNGSQTAMAGSAFSHYVFAPAGSKAATWAANTSATFVPTTSLTTWNGFYYQLSGSTATLLCPVDAKAVPSVVRVPTAVGTAKVTDLSSVAFMDCSQVTKIILPEDVTAQDGAYNGCPNAEIVTPVGTQVTLSATSVNLTATNYTYKLSAQVTGEDLPTTAVRYSTMDSAIAEVDNNGTITAQNSGTTYILVTAADGTQARCRVEVDFGTYPLSITNVPASVQVEDSITVTVSSDNGKALPEPNCWYGLQLSFYDENDLLISSKTKGIEMTGVTDTFEFYCDYLNTARVDLQIVSDRWYTGMPGKNPTASIAVEPATSATEWYSLELRYGDSAYPGSYGRVYVEAAHPELLTSPRTVIAVSEDGLINQTLGTISKDSPHLAADIQFPVQWDYDEYYEINIKIGEQNYWVYTYLFGLSTSDVYIGVDQTINRTFADYCAFPDQWPLTFTVKDSSIASISSTGTITGKKVGITTATVTTSTGHSKTFTITVAHQATFAGKPALSVLAPVKDLYWSDDDLYSEQIAIALPDEQSYLPYKPGEYYEFRISCYDGNDDFIDYVRWGFSPTSGNRIAIYANPSELERSMDINPQTLEEKIHRVEITIQPSDTGLYTIGETPSASVNFHYTNASFGTDAQPTYQVIASTYDAVPGDTIDYIVECLTPELLEEPVTVRLHTPYDELIVSGKKNATLTKDNPSATVSLTVSDDALCGMWLSIEVLAGNLKIDSFDVDIAQPLPVAARSINTTVGSSFTLPIHLTSGMTMQDLIISSGNPAVATVNASGVVTAIAAGSTSISVRMTDKYGATSSSSVLVTVAEVISSTVPTLSTSTTTTAAAYGDPINLKLKLSGAFPASATEDQKKAAVTVALLDKNKSILSTNNFTVLLDEELALQGQTYNVLWPTSQLLLSAKYLCISVENSTGSAAYRTAYAPCLIEITSLPDPSEVLYTMTLEGGATSVRAGGYVSARIERSNLLSNYPQAEIALKTADGTEVYSETMEKSARYCWPYFKLSNAAAIGETMTLYLYVDGKKTDHVLSFKVDEYAMSLTSNRRIAVGSSSTITPYFSGAQDYKPTITYTSSDTSIFTVDANGKITGVKGGCATLTVTTAAGQQKEMSIIVYDPDQCVDPEYYITHTENSGGATSWFGYTAVIIGTETPLYQIDGDRYVYYKTEFLDENGNVIADSDYTNSMPVDDISSESEQSIYISEDSWLVGFESGACTLRITLTESQSSYYGYGDYTYDEDRCQLTFALPAPEDHFFPVVVMDDDVPNGPWKAGDKLSLTCTCLNPDKLEGGKTLELYQNVYDEDGNYISRASLATGTLTKQDPSVTLEYTIPEEWEGKTINLYVQYPSPSHSGTISSGFYISVDSEPMQVSSLAGLQSAHNYPNNVDMTWLYTYTGATRLEVTFDERTELESSSDLIYIGDKDSADSNSWNSIYYNTQLAGQTVTVTGDTVAIRLYSDYSINKWGFAVTKIVAYLADGSTVTITE